MDVSRTAHLRLCDVGVLAVACAFATVAPGVDGVTDVLWPTVFGLLVVSLFSSRGLYRPRLDPRLLDTLRSVVLLTAVAMATVISLRVFVGDMTDVGGEGARLWILATIMLVSGRLYIALAGRRAARIGARVQPTLIVGAGKVGQAVARRLQVHAELGFPPIGFLDEEPLVSGTSLDIPVLGASWDFDDVVAEHGIRHVIVTFSTAPNDVLVRIMNRCEQLRIGTSFVPRFFEMTTERLIIDRLGGLPLVSSLPSNPYGWQVRLKYTFDQVGAAIAIAVFSPILFALAVGVLLSAGRPIVYRQERVGRDGKRFEMLKFRSMRQSPDTDAATVLLPPDTAPGGVEGVDRRTPLGIFMRETSLDELPQLFNVLRGEMSFVGPRPERPQFADVFAQTIHRYGERHRVKSGITGWAQVNGLRGKTSVADRAEWDNYYIENWSLWFDFKILLQTVVTVAFPSEVE